MLLHKPDNKCLDREEYIFLNVQRGDGVPEQRPGENLPGENIEVAREQWTERE